MGQEAKKHAVNANAPAVVCRCGHSIKQHMKDGRTGACWKCFEERRQCMGFNPVRVTIRDMRKVERKEVQS
jgi:hypothetical protein